MTETATPSTNLADRAMQWHHDAILTRYAKQNNATMEDALRCFESFKQFMAVCATDCHNPHAPSRAIDEMWHTALMFTRDYREYCEHHLGGFVDHQPYAGPADPSVYRLTRDAAERLFGSLDPDHWPQLHAGDCCDSSTCVPGNVADCGPGCGRGVPS